MELAGGPLDYSPRLRCARGSISHPGFVESRSSFAARRRLRQENLSRFPEERRMGKTWLATRTRHNSGVDLAASLAVPPAWSKVRILSWSHCSPGLILRNWLRTQSRGRDALAPTQHGPKSKRRYECADARDGQHERISEPGKCGACRGSGDSPRNVDHKKVQRRSAGSLVGSDTIHQKEHRSRLRHPMQRRVADIDNGSGGRARASRESAESDRRSHLKVRDAFDHSELSEYDRRHHDADHLRQLGVRKKRTDFSHRQVKML